MSKFQKIISECLPVLAIFILVDCKKSDIGPSISGTWAVVNDFNTGCRNIWDDLSNLCSPCEVYTFGSNTFSVSRSGTQINLGTYSLSSTVITLQATTSGTQSGPFTLSGNALHFSFKNSSSGCTEEIYLTKKK